jgi:hypothetical protein
MFAMRRFIYIAVLVVISVLPALAQRVKIQFTPESEQFVAAAKEYQTIWQTDGDKIVKAMEKVSGLKFKETEIEAVVYEGVSWSGRQGSSPMKMRASYPTDTKKATLIHELGHRHIVDLRISTPDLDEHRVLFLFLYDLWTQLYGKEFADTQVAVEKRRRGLYPEAWDWALSMTKAEREKRFKEIVDASPPSQEGLGSLTTLGFPASTESSPPTAPSTPASPPVTL